MLVDLVDLAPDQSKLSKNRKSLLGGVVLAICTSVAFWKGVAQMLVDLVDLARDQSKLS